MKRRYADVYNGAYHCSNVSAYVDGELFHFFREPYRFVSTPKYLRAMLSQSICTNRPSIEERTKEPIEWALRVSHLIRRIASRRICRSARHFLYAPGGPRFRAWLEAVEEGKYGF